MMIDTLNEIRELIANCLKMEGLNVNEYRNTLAYIHGICIGSILAYQEEIDSKVEFNRIKENIIKAARGEKI